MKKLISKFFKVDLTYTQLYQNQFINEKIKAEFLNKNSKVKMPTIFQKISNRLFKTHQPQKFLPEYQNRWNSKTNYSKLNPPKIE